MKTEREKYRIQLNETINPKKDRLNQELGKIGTQLEQKQRDIDQKDELKKEIKSYESLQFLEQSFQNLDKERKDIESQLTQIENQNLNSKAIESKIEKADSQIRKITRDRKSVV